MPKQLKDKYGNQLIDVPDEVKTKSFAVVDVDWLGFKVSSVLETRHIVVTRNGEEIGQFKTRTEFKKSDRYDKENDAEYVVEDKQVIKDNYFQSMDFIARKVLSDVKRRAGVDEIVLAAGGSSNFRDRLPAPYKYKGDRVNSIRPLLLSVCKEYLCSAYPTVRAIDMEADDVVGMFQYRSFFDDDYRIVAVTPDKDALQTCGNLMNPEVNKGLASSEVTRIDGLGFIDYIKGADKKPGKAKFQGRLGLYYQILHGDSTDCYSPCQVYKQITGSAKKAAEITELKAYEMLRDCETDIDCLKVIHDKFYDWYKDITGWQTWDGNWVDGDYIDLIQLYWSFAHMKRYPGDEPDVRTILKKAKIID